jgi:hypothetical protein
MMYRAGKFVPFEPSEQKLPTVSSSVDWYRGWRKHLGFAEVQPNLPAAQQGAES